MFQGFYFTNVNQSDRSGSRQSYKIKSEHELYGVVKMLLRIKKLYRAEFYSLWSVVSRRTVK